MKVLLDECVNWRLARDIIGHDVKTARQMGWSTIKNGELLALAGEQFGRSAGSTVQRTPYRTRLAHSAAGDTMAGGTGGGAGGSLAGSV